MPYKKEDMIKTSVSFITYKEEIIFILNFRRVLNFDKKNNVREQRNNYILKIILHFLLVMFSRFTRWISPYIIMASDRINYTLPQQSVHWHHEFALTARCTFAAAKFAPKDNAAAKRRNEEGEREKTTCSPVPSRSRHGRGTSKSTGAFLPLRRCEILCLLRNRVFFSPRPRNTQITNGADVAREYRWERPMFNVN